MIKLNNFRLLIAGKTPALRAASPPQLRSAPLRAAPWLLNRQFKYLNMKQSKQIAKLPPDESGQTFFEGFMSALNEHEAQHPKGKSSADVHSQSFSLYEDLKLLVELSKYHPIEFQHFDRISEILNRPKKVLKQRYQEYLKNITQNDLQHIYDFIESHGLNGYLCFKVDHGGWKLSDIESIQTKTNPKQNTPLVTPFKSVSKPSKVPVSQSAINKHEPQSQKKIKLHQFQLSASSKYDQSQKKVSLPRFERANLKPGQKREADELKQNLKLFAEWIQAPLHDVLQRLYQCSGDLNKLLTVYLEQQESLLWTKEADDALIAYYLEQNPVEKVKLKTVLRSEEENRQRKTWLSV